MAWLDDEHIELLAQRAMDKATAVATKLDLSSSDCWPWPGGISGRRVVMTSSRSGQIGRVEARRVVYAHMHSIPYVDVPRLTSICKDPLCMNVTHWLPVAERRRQINAKIVAMRAEGKLLKQIGHALGVSSGHISMVLRSSR